MPKLVTVEAPDAASARKHAREFSLLHQLDNGGAVDSQVRSSCVVGGGTTTAGGSTTTTTSDVTPSSARGHAGDGGRSRHVRRLRSCGEAGGVWG
jgi:hypothetical protein